MKVALVYPIPFGNDGVFGGGERYAWELATALSKVVDTVLVTTGKARRTLRQGPLRVEVHPWITLLHGLRQNPLTLTFLQSLRGVDVIHCIAHHTLLTDLSILFGRLTQKRVFITDVGGGGDITLSRVIDVTRLAHALLMISEGASRTFRGGQRQRVVIWGGVDTDRYCARPEASRRGVLYVGRLAPHKGVHSLIEAVDAAIPLTLVGRPYDDAYYRSLLALAAGRKVTFVTDASDAEVIRQYQSTAVSVLPSVHLPSNGHSSSPPELLGFALLEAMACATPVVVSQPANLAEIVTDGVDGLVVPPDRPQALRECILALLDDPVRARTMGNEARQTVLGRFTWQGVVDRCLAAYAGGT
jgi:glycosyltransferase involved in cell wall biosynthesis